MDRRNQTRLMCGAAMMALALVAGRAQAQEAGPVEFDILPQSLERGLNEFARQSGRQVMFTPEVAGGRTTRGFNGALDTDRALAAMLEGTGLSWRRSGETYLIVQAGEGGSVPQSAGAGDVDALIVTAQKREEAIQDVPIAISAFSAKALEAQKIEGGFDLLKAIPNVTFSKNNFTSYNFSIRGVGTKAVSATTDPGVAVAFNNSAIIQNRLFEQEYFDVERVEVLRGPQGTLYGRNATSGVINVISAKPKLGEFEATLKGEVGNYDTRRASGMINIPLIDDVLAVRLAGAMTDRQGYDFNSVTNNPVNGRDLWSARLTVGFEPTDRIRGDLIWERFQEDDDRLRTGKQLCHRDPGKQVVGNTPTYPDPDDRFTAVLHPALFSQGCLPGSLYEEAAFSTPNGLAIPFVFGVEVLGYGNAFPIGADANGDPVAILALEDPYGGMMQSRDLRTMASFRDPRYRAKADLIELNVDIDLTEQLTLSSQTAYVKDEVYSFQDFNRFNTIPVFTDTSTISPHNSGFGAYDWRELAPRPAGSPLGSAGVFCDPQLGCSDTMAGFDISQAMAEQFSQEFRLQSNFDGPLNFSVGANYTKFDVLVDYYIMFNLITAAALMAPFNVPVNGDVNIDVCGFTSFFGLLSGDIGVTPAGDPGAYCPYIDPNPVERINGDGHNYFRSKNPYTLESLSGFGELYYQINDTLKLTAGLRYNDDEKVFTPVPSQILLAPTIVAGGAVPRGHPEREDIVQEWGEWTGRLGLDWKPDLPFTDDTLLYAFYSHGYKGGGANPPKPGFASLPELEAVLTPAQLPLLLQFPVPILELTAVEYGETFEPEFVDAYEIGMKNTLLGGAMTFNITGFYYDYKDYQVSQIRDRTAVNENFDAKVWGLEFETIFSPTRNLQIIGNLGYLDTRIANGERSIDIMDRTQGNPDYTLTKAWLQLPSNCVVPTPVAESYLQANPVVDEYWQMCRGLGGLLGAPFLFPIPTDPNPAIGGGALPYDPANYPELNGGAGLMADLGGNELPNAPHWTMNLGAQYGMDFGGWRATVRGDVYWQGQSFARVYNTQYDKLRGWHNVNLSVWIERPDDGLKIELYAKNVFDDTPITDAFLNSDDTALTTNIFVLDPRLVGLSIRKEF